MLPILQVGPLTLRTPGLALIAGLWIGLEVASRQGMRRGIHGDHVYNIGFYALLAGILGARLGFVLFNLKLYTSITPWTRVLGSVFSLAGGTEIVWVGVLVGVGVAAYLIYRWEIDPLALADAFAPGLAIMVIGLGLANLLSGDMYGVTTRLPWGVEMWGAKRHPTQIYFTLVAIGALVVVWRFRATDNAPGKSSGKAKKRAQKTAAERFEPPPGFLLQLLILILGLGLLLIEPLRVDSPLVGPGIRIWMVIGLLGVLFVMATFMLRLPTTAPDAA